MNIYLVIITRHDDWFAGEEIDSAWTDVEMANERADALGAADYELGVRVQTEMLRSSRQHSTLPR